MKLGKLTRAAAFPEPQVDSDTRTMTFPFSSEYPVERWFGTEVLSHEPGAANLARLNDGAPLLYNHDADTYIGVVERAWIEGTRGYATVKFSQNERAQQILRDVEDGILRNVSFGYRVNKMTEADKGTYRVDDWEPLELSLVTIPADPSVGLGRSDDGEATDVEVTPLVEPDDEPPAAADNVNEQQETERMETPDVSVIRAEAAEAERTRIASISALGEKFGQSDLARQLVESGRSLDEARAAFLEKMGAKEQPIQQRSGEVDMTAKEQRSYSVVRAINAAISGDWSKAGLEREVSQTLAREAGRETSGFFMPTNLQMRATYAVGAAATGGNLVETQLLAESFIDILRNRATIMQLGPTMLTGLVGNITIPRKNATTQVSWVTEGNAPSQTEATFDQISLTPKQIAARSQYTRLALQQTTPDIERIVRDDLAAVIALGIDLAAITGTGASGQPRGILNTSGIGSVVGGTNGANISIDHFIDLEREIDIDNALAGNLYYLTNSRVVASAKKIKSTTGEYLWNGTDNPLNNIISGAINGYPIARTNQVPNTLTKGTSSGVCSAVIFGNFNDLVIGMWGGLEILPNPYGAGYNAGSVDIRAMQTVDITVRRAESFAAITDALTP
jgi:HK97 family phage major capsid protein/HK97 family phage prohead protease